MQEYLNMFREPVFLGLIGTFAANMVVFAMLALSER